MDLEEVKGDFGSRSKKGIMIELRFLAYNDMPPYQFSVSCSDARNRLVAIETAWSEGQATPALDVAFWDACHERFYHPRSFLAREVYLGLVADDQIARVTTDSTEKMEKAAKTAKADMIGIENLLDMTTEQLQNLGFERSLDELLEAEMEHAYQTDPDLQDVAVDTASAATVTVRKRPPASARVRGVKRAGFNTSSPAGERRQSDRVVLADKANYFPRPCIKTARRNRIAKKRQLSLGDRMARLTHAQREVINAAFSKVRPYLVLTSFV